LYGPIESFQMSIVIRFPDSGVSVSDAKNAHVFREVLRELWSVVGLHGLEWEWSH